MERRKQTRVLVAGAGPVGMFTALLLAQEGIETQIIDSEPCTAGRSYACALHPRTIKLLDMANLATAAIKQGRRIDAISIYEGGTRRAVLNLAELPVEFPFLLILDQSKLEDLLEEKLKQLARIKVNWNHRLTELDTTTTRAVATIEKLAPTGKGYSVPEFEMGVQGTLFTRAEFVVGADGRNSHIRQLLGLKDETAGPPELYVVYEAECDRETGREMKIVFGETTSSVMWPLLENRCRWNFQLHHPDPAGDFPAKDRTRYIFRDSANDEDCRHHLKRLLRERAPWFQGNIRNVNWAADAQFERRLVERFGGNLTWLAGDSAHQTSPIGMHSLNEGLWEAADLADKLSQIVRGKGAPDLLETYNLEHQAAWRRLLGISGPLKTPPQAEPWVTKRAATILPHIPGSGTELKLLLLRLGLEFD